MPTGNLYQRRRRKEEGYGKYMLELTRNNLHRLFGKVQNYYSCILCIVIVPFENRAVRKTTTIGPKRSSFPSRQRTSSLICSCGSEIDIVRILTHSTSHSFSRFGSLGRLSFPQYEKMTGEKKILFKRGDCGNEFLFCKVAQILLFGGDKKKWGSVERSV